MTVFDRVSRFGRTAKERAAPIWNSGAAQFERRWQWLIARPRRAVFAAGVIFAAILLIGFREQILAFWKWYSEKEMADGRITHPHADLVNPIGTFVGAMGAFATGAFLALAAIRNARAANLQAAIASQQAETASLRHKEQTDADRKRRITETFSKAIEQLGSDKLEVRLGGVYALERISKESPDDYWTVMENLTAFVRERTCRTEAERTSKPFDGRVALRAYLLWENAGKPGGLSEKFWAQAVEQEKLGDPPPTDVAAVLTVIKRRSGENRQREFNPNNKWVLDFGGAFLRKANLRNAHLEGADLRGAHLKGADLTGAHLERADFMEADLTGVRFVGANLRNARLADALLRYANLDRADLKGAHFERANLWNTKGLERDQLANAHGDAWTRLPPHVQRPAHWPSEKPEA